MTKKFSKFTVYVRGSEMEFRIMLKSERLRGFLQEVWKSLPQTDKYKLNDSLAFITDLPLLVDLFEDPIERPIYGAADFFISKGRHFIILNAWRMKYESLEFIRHVIAHEFAHVYFEHPTKSERSKKQKAKLEAEANKQAAKWGYPPVPERKENKP